MFVGFARIAKNVEAGKKESGRNMMFTKAKFGRNLCTTPRRKMDKNISWLGSIIKVGSNGYLATKGGQLK